MQDDENTLDTQEANQESEVVEETAQGEESTETKPEVVSEVKLSPAEYRNFKKWENSKSQASATQPQQVSTQPNVEETVLKANGMSKELLGELKAVAKARGIESLLEAQTDPIFIAVKERFEKEQKSREASLPGSRGSGSVKAEKSFTTPGLSREEHRKMVIESR